MDGFTGRYFFIDALLDFFLVICNSLSFLEFGCCYLIDKLFSSVLGEVFFSLIITLVRKTYVDPFINCFNWQSLLLNTRS